MKLKFIRASFKYTYKSLADFLSESQSLDFKEYICEVYPIFNLEEINKLNGKEREQYIKDRTEELYNREVENMDEKVQEYQKKWNESGDGILECFQSIFGFSMRSRFKEIIVQVGLNPICPRYLKEFKFDCYYKLQPQAALENTIHELTHFAWFEFWKNNFKGYDENTFEYPHIIWNFSEIVIDPILRDCRFEKYCLSERPAYGYFYDININSESMIEKIRRLYSDNSMRDFMIKGLKYCEENKEIIEKYN